MSPLNCFYCKKKEKSATSLIKHLKRKKLLRYKCAVPTCSEKSFGNVETFRSHIKRHLSKETPYQEREQDFGKFLDDSMLLLPNLPQELIPHFQKEIYKKLSALRQEFLKIFLPIYGNENIARKHSIENTRSLYEHFKKSLNLIQESISSFEMNVEDKEHITNLINDLKTSVDIRSEYMLMKELEKTDFYVRSQFVEIARKQQESLNPENEIVIRDIIYGVSIMPLQKTFYNLFNHTKIVHKILEYMETLNTGSSMRNYIQGK